MAANSEAPPSPTTPASDVQPDDGLSSFARACPAPPVDGGRTVAEVAAGKHGKNAKEKKAEKAKAKTESLAAMAPLATTTSKNKKEMEALQKARDEIKKKERAAAKKIKDAKDKQRRLMLKCSNLSNEDLLEIVRQRTENAAKHQRTN